MKFADMLQGWQAIVVMILGSPCTQGCGPTANHHLYTGAQCRKQAAEPSVTLSFGFVHFQLVPQYLQ